MQQKLVEQGAEAQYRLNLSCEQVLARFWGIANLSPAMTRGSIAAKSSHAYPFAPR